MSHRCNPTESDNLLKFLVFTYGGFGIDPMEAHAYKVVFSSGTKAEARQVIEELVLVQQRRPSPADIAARLKDLRRRNEPEPARDLWPEADPVVRDRVLAECRETLVNAGARNVRRPA